MHLSVKVPIEYPIKAIHIKVNSTIQAAKVEIQTKELKKHLKCFRKNKAYSYV